MALALSLARLHTNKHTQVAAKEMESIKGDLAKKKKKSEKMKPVDDDNMSMVSDMTGECVYIFCSVCVCVSTLYLCRARTLSPLLSLPPLNMCVFFVFVRSSS